MDKKPYFTKLEIALWCFSVLCILISFFTFDGVYYHKCIGPIIGVTAILLIAKGNPVGHVFMFTFSMFYGFIAYSYRYYGEMMTYMFMSAPMSLFSLVSWLRHPYKGNKTEVEIAKITKEDILIISGLAVLVTVVFYFILKYFNTANLVVSTISVTTSFYAVSLNFRRSPYFSLAYVANDLVLIVMWIMASANDRTYISVIICFAMFLLNDIYSFISLRRIGKRQKL